MSTPEQPPQKTVLICDDDRELVDSLRFLLERQGYRVLTAHDGVAGKALIAQQRPDVVLLDMMMHKMGGYPVLEHFKGQTDAPPFIMMTATEGSRHKAYAEFLGVVEYLRKPFATEKLLEAIEKAVGTTSQST